MRYFGLLLYHGPKPTPLSTAHQISTTMLLRVSDEAFPLRLFCHVLTDSASSIYMSNGACQQNCLGSFVFAIVQGDYCWCSNDVPTDQVDLSQCNFPCPGWQDDTCGSPSAKLYGYINIGGVPSGTSGGSSSAAQTSVSTIPTSARKALLRSPPHRWLQHSVRLRARQLH